MTTTPGSGSVVECAGQSEHEADAALGVNRLYAHAEHSYMDCDDNPHDETRVLIIQRIHEHAVAPTVEYNPAAQATHPAAPSTSLK